MRKSVLSLLMAVSTVFVMAGGDLSPIEPVEAGKSVSRRFNIY